MCIMINSNRAMKAINAFQFVAIPSPRDIYIKYGQRVSQNPQFTTDSGNYAEPSVVSASSVISQLTMAEKHIMKSTAGSKH